VAGGGDAVAGKFNSRAGFLFRPLHSLKRDCLSRHTVRRNRSLRGIRLLGDRDRCVLEVPLRNRARAVPCSGP